MQSMQRSGEEHFLGKSRGLEAEYQGILCKQNIVMTERVSGDTEEAYSIWLNSGLLSHRGLCPTCYGKPFCMF